MPDVLSVFALMWAVMIVILNVNRGKSSTFPLNTVMVT